MKLHFHPTKRFVVGRWDGTGRRRFFSTMKAAVNFLGRHKDQHAVREGKFYIDSTRKSREG